MRIWFREILPSEVLSSEFPSWRLTGLDVPENSRRRFMNCCLAFPACITGCAFPPFPLTGSGGLLHQSFVVLSTCKGARLAAAPFKWLLLCVRADIWVIRSCLLFFRAFDAADWCTLFATSTDLLIYKTATYWGVFTVVVCELKKSINLAVPQNLQKTSNVANKHVPS